jgi:hypothetical protein
MARVPFNQIAFGYASAEKERAENPELLLEGYLDLHSASDRIVAGSDFLVLGYKGSGKSSVSQHVALRAQSDPTMFAKTLYLADFPFSEFAQIVPGDRDPQARYPTAWSLLLLLYLFDSFVQDGASSLADDVEFQSAVRTLRRLGLLPAPTLREAVLVSSTTSFTIKLPVVEIGATRSRGDTSLRLPFLVDYLRATACRMRSSSKHLVIVDGLDDILADTPVQFDALASLILEASRLNALFADSATPAKVVVLCRTDLYEKLPGANTNKIRQDSAVTLDWYHAASAPQTSELLQLVNLKARVTEPSISDVMKEYFPKQIGNRATIVTLLDHTRHTPRDLLQLLAHIQQTTTDPEPDEHQIRDGIRWYSVDYFLPEIRNDLAGFLEGPEIDAVLDLFAGCRSNIVRYAELHERAKNDDRFKDVDLQRCLAHFFECSAVGQIRPVGRSRIRYTFRYRNRHASLDRRHRLIIHPGLVRALNVPVTQPRRRRPPQSRR